MARIHCYRQFFHSSKGGENYLALHLHVPPIGPLQVSSQDSYPASKIRWLINLCLLKYSNILIVLVLLSIYFQGDRYNLLTEFSISWLSTFSFILCHLFPNFFGLSQSFLTGLSKAFYVINHN